MLLHSTCVTSYKWVYCTSVCDMLGTTVCPSTLLSIFLLKTYEMHNLEYNLDLLKVWLEGRHLLSMLNYFYTHLYHLCPGILHILLIPLSDTTCSFPKLPLRSSVPPLVKTMTMKFSINRNERELVSPEHQ